jgi:aldose 1-epimerase
MKYIWSVAALWLAITLPAEANITVKAWGGVGGKGVDLFTLTNANGMQASITNYGAIITAIRVPGQGGQLTDVVQGFDSLADYTSPDYKGRYGATIGRFANRIKDNSYEIDHVRYRVARDAYVLHEAENKPYDERVWDAAPRDGDEPQLVLTLLDGPAPWAFPAPCA